MTHRFQATSVYVAGSLARWDSVTHWLGDRELSVASQRLLAAWLGERGIRDKLSQLGEQRRLEREELESSAG